MVDRPDLNHTLAPASAASAFGMAPPQPSHPASARVVNPHGTNTDASIAGSALGGTATGLQMHNKKHTAADNAQFGMYVEQKVVKTVHPNCVVEVCYPPGWGTSTAQRGVAVV
jgi:hypothetical protein